MASLFSKFTGSAIQLAKQGSAQIISSVNKAKSAIASTAVNLTVASAASASPFNDDTKPSQTDELILLFREVCDIIDQLTVSPDANTLEMDNRLNQTEIRVKLRRVVEILSQEALLWLVHQRSIADHSQDEEHMQISDTPCIDLFIQMNMISELCNRAMSDSPKGILRLILTTISTILRQVPYPLLPHQSIYRPIAKVIFIASRYEAFIQQDVHTKKSAVEKEKHAAFIRRMDISLTSLLRTIWKKIVENPPCLDYFIVADRRTSSVDQYVESSRGLPKMQIDVLSSLLPLVHNPKVGQYAQESILIALNIRDTRVDFYLAYNTGFTFTLVRNVCDDFNAALNFLQKQLTSNSNIILPSHLIPFCAHNAFNTPFSPSTATSTMNSTHKSTIPAGNKSITPSSSRASITGAAGNSGILGFFPAESTKEVSSKLAAESINRQQKRAQEEEVYNAVTQFLNSLTFLRAVFNALRSREGGHSSNDESNVSGGIRHCLQRISDTYFAEFIQGCLHNALDSTNEVQNSSVYILLKLLLSHLAWTEDRDSDSSLFILNTNRRKLYDNRLRSPLSLLGETLNYLLYSPANQDNLNITATAIFRPGDHYRSIIDRSTSMTKSLSSSANMLQYVIISTVPPLLALQLLNYVPSRESHGPNVFASTFPKSVSSNVHHQLQTLPFEMKNLTFDDALSRCCASLELELSKERSLPLTSMILTVNESLLPQYTQNCSHNLFRKLFHRGDDVLKSFGKLSFVDDADISITRTSTTSVLSDNMLSRTLKRLHAFSSLRIDEQITLSGLVNEISSLLCTSMLLVSSNQANEILQQFYTLFRKVNSLRTELNTIVRQIPDVRKKMHMMKEHLQDEAAFYVSLVDERVDVSSHLSTASKLKGDTNSPSYTTKFTTSAQSRRKLIECETMQYKQLMTSAIILQEMEHEVLGYLFATKSVARMLHDQQYLLWEYTASAPESQNSESSNLPVGDIFFGESLVDTRRVDEEEFRVDLDDVEHYRELMSSLSASLTEGKGYSFLDLDRTEKNFVAELDDLEVSIAAVINGASAFVDLT